MERGRRSDIAEDSVTIITTTIPTSHLHLFREAMAVEKRANGWRARRKKDGKTFNGPLRATEVAANEDAPKSNRNDANAEEIKMFNVHVTKVDDRYPTVSAVIRKQVGLAQRARNHCWPIVPMSFEFDPLWEEFT